MPKREHSELAAGIFALVAVAAALAVVFWLGTTAFFKKEFPKAYLMYPESSGNAGLAVGDYVYLGGNMIGTVTGMVYKRDVPVWPGQAPSPTTTPAGPGPELVNGTMYVVEVYMPKFQLYRNGRAVVPFALVGSAQLVITSAGSPRDGEGRKVPEATEQAPLVMTPGDLAQLSETAAHLRVISENLQTELSRTNPDTLLSRALELARKLDVAAGKVVEVVDDVRKQTNVENKDGVMANLQVASANIRTQTDVNVKDSLMAKVQDAAANIDAMTVDARPKLSKTLGAIEGYATKDMAQILDDVKKTMAQFDGIVKNLDTLSANARDVLVLNRHQLDQAITDLASMASNLNAAASEIRRNPWRLLQKPTEKGLKTQNIYDAARAFAEGAAQLDNALTQLKTLQMLHPEGIKAENPELIRIRENLKQSFENFKKVEAALWKEAAP